MQRDFDVEDVVLDGCFHGCLLGMGLWLGRGAELTVSGDAGTAVRDRGAYRRGCRESAGQADAAAWNEDCRLQLYITPDRA